MCDINQAILAGFLDLIGLQCPMVALFAGETSDNGAESPPRSSFTHNFPPFSPEQPFRQWWTMAGDIGSTYLNRHQPCRPAGHFIKTNFGHFSSEEQFRQWWTVADGVGQPSRTVRPHVTMPCSPARHFQKSNFRHFSPEEPFRRWWTVVGGGVPPSTTVQPQIS